MWLFIRPLLTIKARTLLYITVEGIIGDEPESTIGHAWLPKPKCRSSPSGE